MRVVRRISSQIGLRRTRPCPACRSPARRRAALELRMMSWPASPRIRMRPIGPGSPMRMEGAPRATLAGGASERSGRWPSRVWMTSMPAASRRRQQRACTARSAACSSETSLPSVSPKPPGSRKSRCMSMMISAADAGSKETSTGSAAIVAIGMSSLPRRHSVGIGFATLVPGRRGLGATPVRPLHLTEIDGENAISSASSNAAARPRLVVQVRRLPRKRSSEHYLGIELDGIGRSAPPPLRGPARP